MINWDKLGDKRKYVLIIFIIILIIEIIIYGVIICNKIQKKLFVNNLMEIVEKNQDPIFSIEKIHLCSSANVIYNSSSDGEILRNLSIYQYTDIAIYLNNYQDENGLTNENTIKELYIDNIEIIIDENEGNQSLNYTNPLTIGSKNIVPNFNQVNRIDFNIIYSNSENETADYDEPTFYTDCSNPITLRYVNDLGTDYSIQDDSSSSFDGSILEDAGISIEDLNCKIKFKINIVNNEGNYYSCWVNFSLPLSDIYDGTTIKSTTLSGYKYDFFASL